MNTELQRLQPQEKDDANHFFYYVRTSPRHGEIAARLRNACMGLPTTLGIDYNIVINAHLDDAAVFRIPCNHELARRWQNNNKIDLTPRQLLCYEHCDNAWVNMQCGVALSYYIVTFPFLPELRARIYGQQ